VAEGSLGVEIRSQEEDTPARRQLDGLSAWSRTPGAGKLADRPEHQDASGPSATRAATSFRIFLNYRREDASGHAGRLYDFLRHGRGEVAGFRKEQIFMDIDTIAPGVDFRRVIEDAVGSCDVFIAVMGRQWLDATDAHGRRRLDKGNDFVRLEIEAALARDIPVVPVLVQGAQMPSAEELPETLDDFAHRNAVELSDARWDYDVGRLTAWLSTLEEEKPRREQAERERQEQEKRERLEREAAEQAERDRKTREAAERAERERLEKEAADAAERERQEREAAERERRDREAAAKAEAAELERLEREREEQDAGRVEREQERVAAEEAEAAERKRPEAAKLAEQHVVEEEAAERAEQLPPAITGPPRRRIRLPRLKRRYWISIAGLVAGTAALLIVIVVLRSGGEAPYPNDSEQELLDHVPASLRYMCSRSSVSADYEAQATISCTSLDLPFYVTYRLVEDMQKEAESLFVYCLKEPTTWQHGEICEDRHSTAGTSLYWTDDRFGISGQVEGTELSQDELHAKWECCLQLQDPLDVADDLRSLGNKTIATRQ
jgi:hypothetical protein